MSPRGRLRRLRRTAFVRCCAGLIIALVLCPFTAPFASYDPNASPIGGVTQDGSLFDIAGSKAVSTAAVSISIPTFSDAFTVTIVVTASTPGDLFLLRSMVLRV